MPILESVRQVIQKFQLITSGQILIVGVSGGTDSLALLHMLHLLASRLGIKLHAATLDHQLRGEESAGDVRYVQQICDEWGVDLTTGQADVTTMARERQLGIEAAARLARYNFLAEVARQQGAQTVAVAHHADDQAETVFIHILRGAGLRGLVGMALRSPMPDHTDLSLIRPLLRFTRAEIERYCLENQISPRDDSTNKDTTLLRNAVRIEVLPYLERYSPHIKAALGRLAEIAAVEDDYMRQALLLFTQSPAVTVSARQISIDRAQFRDLHPALQRRVLLWGVAQLGQMEDASAHLVLAAVEMGLRGKHGAIALFGGGLQLRVEYDKLLIEPTAGIMTYSAVPLLPQEFHIQINPPFKVVLDQWAFHASLTHPQNGATFCRLVVPEGAHLELRTRRKGDMFAPLGMKGHTQKVSRWMVNHKIPLYLRDQIPLIVLNEAVAAICDNGQWFISESFAVKNTLEHIIYFQFLENS